MKCRNLVNLLVGLGLILALGAGNSLAQDSTVQGEMSVQATVGTAFTYQGRLVKNGSPVTGACDFQFSLWTDVWAGSQVGSTATKGNVTLDAGNFSVGLDFGASAFQGDARYLQIAVRCPAGSGSYTTLSGRVSLDPTPYAHSLRPGAVVSSNTAGQLGAVLTVEDYYSGMLASTAIHAETNQGTAIHGESLTGAGMGVEGKSASNGTGVRGESYSGYGIYGEATATSGTTYGVYGKTNSPDGYGVYARNTASGAAYDEPTAIYGEVNAAEGFAVMGVNSSGRGIYGEGTARYGVGGFSHGSSGVFGKGLDGGIGVTGEGAATGIKGSAQDSSGETYGVHGLTSSPDGSGVYGVGGKYGVYGYNMDGIGVYGRSSGGTVDTGIGVKGIGTTAGVYGQTDWFNAAGGRFKNVYDSANENAVGVWAGSYYGDIFQGWELLSDGNPHDRRFRVTWQGDAYIDGTYYDTGADFAEMLPGADGLEPGDVLTIGPDGQLRCSTKAGDSAVVGVYSTKPAFVGGSDEAMENPGKIPLAIVGIVPVKASAENGPITPGDLLVASTTPGHAMKADANPSIGTVIGKALEGLKSDTGLIQMLVMLQ